MGTLDDKPFDEYVTVKAPRGQRQNISRARQAAEWLLYKWPTEIDTSKGARGPQGLPRGSGGPAQGCYSPSSVSRRGRGSRHPDRRRQAPCAKAYEMEKITVSGGIDPADSLLRQHWRSVIHRQQFQSILRLEKGRSRRI
jgi:hypothetical protein